jgi:hypothetical protein
LHVASLGQWLGSFAGTEINDATAPMSWEMKSKFDTISHACCPKAMQFPTKKFLCGNISVKRELVADVELFYHEQSEERTI